MNQKRLERVLGRLERMGLEQVLITDETSIFYLTGIHIEAEERFLALYLNRNGEHRFFVNRMFTLPSDPGMEVIRFTDTDPYLRMLADCIEKKKALGIDKDMRLRYFLPLLDMGCAVKYVNASMCVDETRALKDEEEQKDMRLVSSINDKAMAEFKKLLKEGVTEQEVSNQMREIYQSLGADDFSFPPSVCFGANAAIGHYRSGKTALKPGDSILLDVGCKKGGYCADMTRTFFCQYIPDDESRRIYELVLTAVQRAEEMIRPGVKLCDIDRAARTVIEEGGYGAYFTHRLGHFIGLQVHDFGDISCLNEEMAKPGQIFSIEPGIYIPGKIGVRIEDLVLVTDEGCEIFNHYSKELQIV